MSMFGDVCSDIRLAAVQRSTQSDPWRSHPASINMYGNPDADAKSM